MAFGSNKVAGRFNVGEIEELRGGIVLSNLSEVVGLIFFNEDGVEVKLEGEEDDEEDAGENDEKEDNVEDEVDSDGLLAENNFGLSPNPFDSNLSFNLSILFIGSLS